MTDPTLPHGTAPTSGTEDELPQVRVVHVTALVRDAVGVEVTDPTADLLSTGIVDSLAFVSLLLAIEHDFRISVDVERIDLDDLRSIESITRFVNRELRAATLVLPDDRA